MAASRRPAGKGTAARPMSAKRAERALLRARALLQLAEEDLATDEKQLADLQAAERRRKRLKHKTPVRGMKAAAARVAAGKKKAVALKREVTTLARCVDAFRADEARKKKKAQREKRARERLLEAEAERHRRIHERLDVLAANLWRPLEIRADVPGLPGPRSYGKAALSQVSLWVCEWMRRGLRAAAEKLGGVALVYRYPESLEVDGRLIVKIPPYEEGDEFSTWLAEVAQEVQDELRDVDPDVLTASLKDFVGALYTHELWVQGVVVVHVNEKGNDSPFDRSKVLPGGVIEGEMRSNWSHDVNLGVAIANVVLTMADHIYRSALIAFAERSQEAEFTQAELRFHWSLSPERPDRRLTASIEEDKCRADQQT